MPKSEKYADAHLQQMDSTTNVTNSRNIYLNLFFTFEGWCRRFINEVKYILEQNGINDITGIQAIVLYCMSGKDKNFNIRLMGKNYGYSHLNVTYNINKVVDNGYLEKNTLEHDKRANNLKLTNKGEKLMKIINSIFQRGKTESSNKLNDKDLEKLNSLLKKIENPNIIDMAKEMIGHQDIT